MIKYFKVEDTAEKPETDWWIELTGYSTSEISDIEIATQTAMSPTQILFIHYCGHDTYVRCKQTQIL